MKGIHDDTIPYNPDEYWLVLDDQPYWIKWGAHKLLVWELEHQSPLIWIDFPATLMNELKGNSLIWQESKVSKTSSISPRSIISHLLIPKLILKDRFSKNPVIQWFHPSKSWKHQVWSECFFSILESLRNDLISIPTWRMMYPWRFSSWNLQNWWFFSMFFLLFRRHRLHVNLLGKKSARSGSDQGRHHRRTSRRRLETRKLSRSEMFWLDFSNPRCSSFKSEIFFSNLKWCFG